jgi:hypothetical protein
MGEGIGDMFMRRRGSMILFSVRAWLVIIALRETGKQRESCWCELCDMKRLRRTQRAVSTRCLSELEVHGNAGLSIEIECCCAGDFGAAKSA